MKLTLKKKKKTETTRKKGKKKNLVVLAYKFLITQHKYKGGKYAKLTMLATIHKV